MLRIGQFDISNTLFLAPMAGVTDSIFRSICVEQGAGFVTSEMVSSDTTLHNTSKTVNRVRRANTTLPHSVQIVGSDPHKLAQAAQYNVTLGADIIDINMGCPAKKVCNKLAGSALLEDEKLVAKILRAVVKAVDVPVTLKIRTGPDRERRNGVNIARIAEANGVQALAVHGRTRVDRFAGEAEYDTIREIKQTISIPVIANGDIRTPADAVRVLQHTHADGLMIGRAAQGNPWLFREIRQLLDTGKVTVAANDCERHNVLTRHVQELHALHGEFRGVRIARKHISWYCKHQRGSANFRNTVNQVETATEQLALIAHFFERPDDYDQSTAA